MAFFGENRYDSSSAAERALTGLPQVSPWEFQFRRSVGDRQNSHSSRLQASPEESAAASRVSYMTDKSRDDRTAPASRKGSRLFVSEPGSAQRIAHPRLDRRQPAQQQRADGVPRRRGAGSGDLRGALQEIPEPARGRSNQDQVGGGVASHLR